MPEHKRIFDLLTTYSQAESTKTMLAGKINDHWVSYTVIDSCLIIEHVSKGLLEKGLRKGDRVAIMSGNRPEWTLCDFACNQIGAAIVPLYPTLSDHDLDYIIQDAGIQFFFASNPTLAQRIQQSLQRQQSEGAIYVFDANQDFTSWQTIRELGQQSSMDIASFAQEVQEDDLLTLLYTSGTTGQPKGVGLSHRNILTNVQDCIHLLPQDFHKALSFLPLCHIFERMVVYLYLSKHIEIYFVETHENLVVNINEIKPDGFTTVPRVLEKVYDKIV
jgi:long-chain acyl-CoA synthetase